ncbi:MAG: metallophosphoesterase family protein [Candidatus Coatesbacteria bacterium]|nr:MAG: metallophosphoesterase family protein [Candidatus Coatesbacteria bacterium]
MKIAVFSDIHSNLEAYGASVVDMARRGDVEAMWCLGDVVGYGADPEQCLQLTAALAGDATPAGDAELEDAVAALAGKLRYVVLGNHDAASFGDRIINYFNETARRAALWTADHISSEARLALQNYPATATEDGVFLVHASPLHPREFHYINSIGDAAAAFAATEAQLIFCGHTHKPVVVIDREGRPIAVPPRDFGVGERSLVNVGSIGQPRDGDARACYVVYDSAEARLEFVRVPYDVEAAAAKIREAGLPRVLADRLAYGW